MTRDLHSQMLNRTITDKLPLPQEDNMRGQDLYNKETDQNKIKTCLSIGASRLTVQKNVDTSEQNTKTSLSQAINKMGVQTQLNKNKCPKQNKEMPTHYRFKNENEKKKQKTKNKKHCHLKTKQNKKSSLQTINEITSLNLLTLPLVTLS